MRYSSAFLAKLKYPKVPLTHFNPDCLQKDLITTKSGMPKLNLAKIYFYTIPKRFK